MDSTYNNDSVVTDDTSDSMDSTYNNNHVVTDDTSDSETSIKTETETDITNSLHRIANRLQQNENLKIDYDYNNFDHLLDDTLGEDKRMNPGSIHLHFGDESSTQPDNNNNPTTSDLIDHKGIQNTVNFLYIQMEYCEGGTLINLIQKDLYKDQQKILKIFQQILNAVDYIHRKTIIHRDLKPANIFFDGNENAKVGDFGLVYLKKQYKTLSNQTNPISTTVQNKSIELTENNEIVGTFQYAPPEQLTLKSQISTKVPIWFSFIIL